MTCGKVQESGMIGAPADASVMEQMSKTLTRNSFEGLRTSIGSLRKRAAAAWGERRLGSVCGGAMRSRQRGWAGDRGGGGRDGGEGAPREGKGGWARFGE